MGKADSSIASAILNCGLDISRKARNLKSAERKESTGEEKKMRLMKSLTSGYYWRNERRTKKSKKMFKAPRGSGGVQALDWIDDT